jgi:hypothetical protein
MLGAGESFRDRFLSAVSQIVAALACGADVKPAWDQAALSFVCTCALLPVKDGVKGRREREGAEKA